LLVSHPHRRTEGWKCVAPGECPDEQGIVAQGEPDRQQRLWKIGRRVEITGHNAEVVRAWLDRHHVVDADRIYGLHPREEPFVPSIVELADHQRSSECALDERQAFEDILERPVVQKRLRPPLPGPSAAHREQFSIEQIRRHGVLVRRRLSGDKNGVSVATIIRSGLRHVLDFALPPRCAGCGAIVDEVNSFCPPCWTQVHFLGDSGCATCGMPLEATDAELCGACLAKPPRIQRTRSAVAYDELSRTIAIRLKYGRKVALARTMARYMAPLVRSEDEAILVPVPLHRSRLWQRGFNQSALVAEEIAKATGHRSNPRLLRRVKRTPALKGMSLSQRRNVVAGAFKVAPETELEGRTVVLVDDVLTTGSTANACAKALQRAGASRVELVSWARVIRPMQLTLRS
jgi:ComF family protein